MFCKIRVCKIDADPDDADLLCFSQKSLRGSASFDRSIISQNINLAKLRGAKNHVLYRQRLFRMPGFPAGLSLLFADHQRLLQIDR